MEIYENSMQQFAVLQETMEEIDFNSNKVEPPMNFYLSSLEEQVRCELLDSKARLTQTTSAGRVLLEVDEDCLQHFLDVLHEQNEREPLDVNAKHAAALKKANQLLKNGQRQWQEEKSALKARQQNNCDHFHSQVKVIASIQAQERDAQKQKLERAQALHQTQMEEQRQETNRIAAALKKTQDLLETERHVRPKTIPKQEMELFRNLCNARIVELVNDNTKLKAALGTAEQALKTGRRQWQEKSKTFTDQNKNSSELYQSQVKIISHFAKQEREAKQKLKEFQSIHEAQLQEQSAETNLIKATLKETEDMLATERVRFQEQFSHMANLEKNYSDLEHAQQKNMATLQSLEEEAKEMLERDQASQTHLKEQTSEINRIKAARKKTEDLLETERFLWEQEKSSLLQATEKDLQSQIPNKPKKKKKKKWCKLF